MTPKRQLKITGTDKEIVLEIIGPVAKAADVLARLEFAKRRLSDLQRLNGGDLVNAPAQDRQQLVQEFLFHLVGGIHFLAQVVDTERELGLHVDQVTPAEVCKRLPEADPVRDLLGQLHPRTDKKAKPPDDWDSDAGCHYRIIVLRNRVCHQGHSPFYFRFGAARTCHLFIDPRHRQLGKSQRPAIEDLQRFWELVSDKCRRTIDLL
jgi:hypothetical protein